MIKLANETVIETMCDTDKKMQPEVDELRRGSFIENGFVYTDDSMTNLMIWI